MSEPSDWSGPCQVLAWLRPIYYARVAGQAVTETRFGERSTRYASSEIGLMRQEIADLEQACARKSGAAPPRRAISLGSGPGRMLPPYPIGPRGTE